MAAQTRRNNIQASAREPLLAIMRCYFNLVNGSEKIIDHDGIEVRDIAQAHLQAMNAIEELREEDLSAFGDWADWSLEVTDSSGNVLFSINLGSSLH